MSYETPPTGAVGWLFGQVPERGYNRIRAGSTGYTVGGKSFRDFLAELDFLTPWTWGVAADGRIQITAGTDVLTWGDRLGWLLGFDREGRESMGAISPTVTAPRLSPALIPLFERVYERVDHERERQLILDRFGRGHGYLFGAAEIWRWRLRLHRTGLEAWRTGWCGRGPIVCTPYTMTQHIAGSVSEWSESTPGGYVSGRVLGTEGPPRPIDGIGRMYELRLIMSVGWES